MDYNQIQTLVFSFGIAFICFLVWLFVGLEGVSKLVGTVAFVAGWLSIGIGFQLAYKPGHPVYIVLGCAVGIVGAFAVN